MRLLRWVHVWVCVVCRSEVIRMVSSGAFHLPSLFVCLFVLRWFGFGDPVFWDRALRWCGACYLQWAGWPAISGTDLPVSLLSTVVSHPGSATEEQARVLAEVFLTMPPSPPQILFFLWHVSEVFVLFYFQSVTSLQWKCIKLLSDEVWLPEYHLAFWSVENFIKLYSINEISVSAHQLLYAINIL